MTSSQELVDALDRIRAGATAADLESQTLEFKTESHRSLPDTMKLLAQACACLANARGGLVAVGVRDDVGGPRAIVGTSLDPDITRSRIFELTDPSLVVAVEQVPVPEGNLLALAVPLSPTVHAVDGRSSERIGRACQRMTPTRIASVVAERRGDDWSAEDAAVPVDACDAEAVAAARNLLARLPGPVSAGIAKRSQRDMLATLGVLSPSGSLSNAGVLLFTEPAGATGHIAYSYRRTPSGALTLNEQVGGPLLLALSRVLGLADVRIDRTSVNLADGQQLQVADLPEAAIREAVVNAVMHRDYRRNDRVLVEQSPTRFAVWSPGSFISGVTPQNVLTTPSRTRNPALAGALRMLGLAETAGTGVDRMYVEMARVGHEPPAFAADADHVQVTLLGGAPNAHLTRFTASLPPDESEDADTLLVILTLLGRRTVSASQMAPLMQRDEAQTQAVLARLAANSVGLIEPTRESSRNRFPNYRLRGEALAELGPAVAYKRRAPDEYDRKIIGLVRESGSINGRTVRLLLDVGTVPASRILADLVMRGVLVKTSLAQRGSGVTYGPGPAFPVRATRRRGTGETG